MHTIMPQKKLSCVLTPPCVPNATPQEIVNDNSKASALTAEADRLEELRTKDHMSAMGRVAMLRQIDLDIMSDQLGIIVIGTDHGNLQHACLLGQC